MLTTIQFLLTVIMMATLVGCFWGWVAAGRRAAARGAPLPFEIRRPVPWGLIDLGIAFVVVLAVQVVALGVVLRTCGVPLTGELTGLPPAQRVIMMAGMGGASLLAWATVLVLVKLRSRATWSELGFVPGRGWSDLRLGLVAFAMLSVPVFLVQWILTLILEPWGFGQHPLIESLLENPDPGFFIVAAISAVVVAPLVEEYFFRLMLQGWLENLNLFRRLRREKRLVDDLYTRRLIVGSEEWPAVKEFSEESQASIVIAEAGERSPTDPNGLAEDPATNFGGGNPYAPPRVTQSKLGEDIPRETLPQPAWWPVIVSSLVFASAHFGHGAAPVPLFLLALGLGYLYQRTHRILPCIIVHALVNGLSMVQLWVLTQ